MFKIKKIVNLPIIGLIAGVIILAGLGVKQYFDYLSLQQDLDNLKEDIQVAQIEKKVLEEQTVQYSEDAYLESEARNKFNLKKPQEKVVVIKNVPDFEKINSELPLPQKIVDRQKGNLVLWWQYFFANQNNL